MSNLVVATGRDQPLPLQTFFVLLFGITILIDDDECLKRQRGTRRAHLAGD
jgi:hypothetical protein